MPIMTMDNSTIKRAVRKAKREFSQGARDYDEKHRTYNPASYAENILQRVSDLIGYHELLSFEPGNDNPTHPTYSYINSGDIYGLTLIYNHRTNKFIYSDIGTIIERYTYANSD